MEFQEQLLKCGYLVTSKNLKYCSWWSNKYMYKLPLPRQSCTGRRSPLWWHHSSNWTKFWQRCWPMLAISDTNSLSLCFALIHGKLS